MLKQSGSVLLVEDDEIDVMNIQRAFKKNDIKHRIEIANNGLEALSLLRNSNSLILPELVLLDLNMPKMNGLEFLEEVRKDELLRSLLIIILTTSNDEKDIKTAYKYNVAGYVVKPVNFESLVQAVGVLNKYLSLCQLP